MKPIPDNRNHSITRNKRGFTLIELMISMGVLSILAGITAQIFVAILDSRDVALKRLEVNENARTVLDFIGADIRQAYLTPDSVKPIESRNPNEGPRFRFVGISRDIAVDEVDGVPGAGIDDDGDGLIDEEVLDGVDGDYPSGAKTALTNGRVVPDPLDCPDGDSACVDEDIGLFPSDILHFVTASENSGDTILQEVSYGLNPEGTRLVRRFQILNLSSGPRNELADFGQFIDNSSNKRLIPPPAPLGGTVSSSALRNAMQNWDDGAKFGQLQSRNVQSNQSPAKVFQVLAYDVRGLRFRYWYYDYNRGGWRFAREWDSSRETALITPGQNLFNQPALNNSAEGRNRLSFENIIINEPEDMYPRLANTPDAFLVTTPRQLIGIPEFSETFQQIAKRTDGLPNIVEITIFVQDRERTLTPKAFSTRVFVPNNYRSIGI